MRRFITLSLLLAFLFLIVSPGVAGPKFSRGEQSKLKGWFSVLLDRGATDSEFDRNYAQYVNFWDQRKSKMLKEIDQLVALMSSSPKRPDSRKGVLAKQLDVKKDLGIEDSREKYRYVVSVPEKYRSTAQSPAWPLILCVPDEGQSPMDYLDKYWKNQAIRDSYVIVVFGHNYKPIKVLRDKEVREDDKVTMVKEEVEEPFTWDSQPALTQFWGGMMVVQTRDFKIDPNRIILDGAGRGSSGVLHYAAASAYRFAGVILRGGELDSPTLPNLTHLRMAILPHSGSGEGAAKTLEALKNLMPKDMLSEAPRAAETGLVAPAWDGGTEEESAAELKKWLDETVRLRYPLPSKWVRNAAAEQYGYWVAVNTVFDAEKPAVMTVNSDRKRGRIDIEATNVEKFSLFLNDVIVDLDKPFDVFVNGEKVDEFERPRSAEELLNHAIEVAPLDLGAVFTAKIKSIRLEQPPEEVKDEPKDGEEKDPDEGK